MTSNPPRNAPKRAGSNTSMPAADTSGARPSKVAKIEPFPTRDIDFTKKWWKSDLALRTANSEQPLFVNKTVLAIHSPYFDALLCGEFEEAKKDEVSVDIDHDLMLEVLNILHSVDRQFGKDTGKDYSAAQLVDFYTAADRFDIPLIRSMVKQLLESMGNAMALEVAVKLGLDDVKSQVIRKMNSLELQHFCRTQKIIGNKFSLDDVLVIMNKQNEEYHRASLPSSFRASRAPGRGSGELALMPHQWHQQRERSPFRFIQRSPSPFGRMQPGRLPLPRSPSASP